MSHTTYNELQYSSVAPFTLVELLDIMLNITGKKSVHSIGGAHADWGPWSEKTQSRLAILIFTLLDDRSNGGIHST